MSNTEILKYNMVKVITEKLLTPNNRVTTLEVKNELINTYPEYYWSQSEVSTTLDKMMNEEGDLYILDDNGVFRTYSSKKQTSVVKTPVTPTNNKIGRKKVLEVLEQSKGKFITVNFIKKDNTDRTMNCKYIESDTLGYAKVIETRSKIIKSVNLQTIKSVKSGGTLYLVR